MLSYVWPIALVVISNIVYQICATSVPERLDPFASLTMICFVATNTSGILYVSCNRGDNLIREYQNWIIFY